MGKKGGLCCACTYAVRSNGEQIDINMVEDRDKLMIG